MVDLADHGERYQFAEVEYTTIQENLRSILHLVSNLANLYLLLQGGFVAAIGFLYPNSDPDEDLIIFVLCCLGFISSGCIVCVALRMSSYMRRLAYRAIEIEICFAWQAPNKEYSRPNVTIIMDVWQSGRWFTAGYLALLLGGLISLFWAVGAALILMK
jgi:hypothetical protein